MASLHPMDAVRWAAVARAAAAGLPPPEAAASGRDIRRALRITGERASSLARRSSLLVVTDVEAFYPSVRPRPLAGALLRAGTGRRVAEAAADLVEGWGSEGYAGLPIGPRPSAIIAEALLVPVDRALEGTSFLRWSDDYLIAVGSELGAREVLERFDEAARSVGLRRSDAKTRIVEGGSGFRWLGRSVR